MLTLGTAITGAGAFILTIGVMEEIVVPSIEFTRAALGF